MHNEAKRRRRRGHRSCKTAFPRRGLRGRWQYPTTARPWPAPLAPVVVPHPTNLGPGCGARDGHPVRPVAARPRSTWSPSTPTASTTSPDARAMLGWLRSTATSRSCWAHASWDTWKECRRRDALVLRARSCSPGRPRGCADRRPQRTARLRPTPPSRCGSARMAHASEIICLRPAAAPGRGAPGLDHATPTIPWPRASVATTRSTSSSSWPSTG